MSEAEPLIFKNRSSSVTSLKALAPSGLLFLPSVWLFLLCCWGFAQSPRANPASSLKVITGHPGSVVFIDEVRHGSTDETGALELKLRAGSHVVRVRTVGFEDRKLPV